MVRDFCELCIWEMMGCVGLGVKLNREFAQKSDKSDIWEVCYSNTESARDLHRKAQRSSTHGAEWLDY